MSKIKPCPWCGHMPRLEPGIAALRLRVTVECCNLECPARPGCTYNTQEEAERAWNNLGGTVTERDFPCKP